MFGDAAAGYTDMVLTHIKFIRGLLIYGNRDSTCSFTGELRLH